MMLSTESSDSKKKIHEIEINDVDYEIMVNLIRYIYSGNFNFLNKHNVLKTIEAANKFRIDIPIKKFKDYLSEGLNMENVVDVLVIADSNNIVELKSQAIIFIVNKIANFDDLQLSKLSELNANLVQEIFREMANKSKSLEDEFTDIFMYVYIFIYVFLILFT